MHERKKEAKKKELMKEEISLNNGLKVPRQFLKTYCKPLQSRQTLAILKILQKKISFLFRFGFGEHWL